MQSLRGKLLLGTAVGMTFVFMASGILLYVLIRRTLSAEFDRALADKARAVATLIEQEGHELEFELAEASLPEFAVSREAEFYQVYRADGSVFARSPSLGGTNLPRPSVESDAPEFSSILLPDGRAGRSVGITLVPRSDDALSSKPLTVTLVMARATAILTATLGKIRAILAGVGLMVVLFAGGALMQVVRSGLRPVERLSEQIAAVGSNDLSARLPNSAVPRELLPIVERLNDLLARVDAAFQRERRFTGDVAHELRTPLAGLRAKLELALSRERSPGSYRQTLTECLQIGWQLQRMTESLLQLARADAGQLDVARDTIDLAQLIRTCWGAFAELARTRDFCIDWDLRAGCCLETDAEKLRVIVHNLLDNAISYTSPSGRIAISAFVADSTAAFNISNTGCSMSPADIPRLFERFWRGAPFSDPGAQTHCGLGLPLCKTLVDRMGGTLEATISKSGVFTAVVRIPARVGQTGH